MSPRHAKSLQEKGARAVARAQRPGSFICQHIQPLFFRRTDGDPTGSDYKDITSEEQFWGEDGSLLFGDVRLTGFRLSDWFPRAPGVYWSERAREVRKMVWSREARMDPELGWYFSPQLKADLIEEGGIGTIRLHPRRIDGEDCWLATALQGSACHSGIPLAIPDQVLRRTNVDWGDRVEIRGRVRSLLDANLGDTAAEVHHARPVIVFVDKLRGVAGRRSPEPIIITPVALFESEGPRSERNYEPAARYTFVQCTAGSDSELDGAADWIKTYAKKYAGRVITNFDEQRPVLADAPLSYQRLVAKSYDRSVIKHFTGPELFDRIDRLLQQSVTNQSFVEVYMGHKINVGGSAILNIDTTLTNVTQTLGSAPGLDAEQKSKLESLVQLLTADLEKLKASHADETKEIAEALAKAVANASKPPQERKKSLLQLSAKSLKEAAELVKDIAPNILKTAGLIAKFVVDL